MRKAARPESGITFSAHRNPTTQHREEQLSGYDARVVICYCQARCNVHLTRPTDINYTSRFTDTFTMSQLTVQTHSP